MRPIPSRVAALVLALLAGAAPARAQLGLNEGPLVRFDERVHDFGDVSQAAHLDHVFRLSNAGTEPLVITNVEASCGCTAVAPADSTILPGASSGIEVMFSSGDFKGPQSKVIAVYTNDPAEPRIDLLIQANVIPFIRLDREWIDFGEVEVGTTPTVGALVTADLESDFRIRGVEGGEAIVEWRIVPASAPNEIAYRLEAHLRPDAPIGRFSERIVLEVDHPNRQLERIGLRGHVFSYFLIDEPKLNFHTVQVGRRVSRSLEIRRDSDRRYSIREVEVPAGYLSANLTETGGGYRLDVTLDSGAATFDGQRHRFREFAVLRTDDPREPEIVVELTGAIRR